MGASWKLECQSIGLGASEVESCSAPLSFPQERPQPVQDRCPRSCALVLRGGVHRDGPHATLGAGPRGPGA